MLVDAEHLDHVERTDFLAYLQCVERVRHDYVTVIQELGQFIPHK